MLKGLKKVFRKTVKVLKKIAKPLIIAAAIYFTAGLAAAAFAPASALAAMPGIPAAASALGIGGGAAAASTTATAAAGQWSASAGYFSGASAPTAAAAATQIPASTGFFAKVGAGIKGMLGTGAAGRGGAAAAMSFTDKLMLASVGTQALGAMLQPSEKELMRTAAEEQAKFRGAFFGLEAGGVPAPQPRITPQPYPQAPAPAQVLPPGTVSSKPGMLDAQKPQIPSMAQRMSAPKLVGDIQKQVKGTSEFDLFGGQGKLYG